MEKWGGCVCVCVFVEDVVRLEDVSAVRSLFFFRLSIFSTFRTNLSISDIIAIFCDFDLCPDIIQIHLSRF